MSRAYVLLFLISGLWAQTANNAFEKAPPDVDDALRDRVSKFYQAHVDKKFRQADLYVAEESKEWFFAANKPACLSFKIDQITYSENFTKAKVVMFCKQYIRQPLFADAPPMDVPMGDHWKVENGQWFWYMDLSADVPTPMGNSKLKPNQAGGPAPQLPSVDSIGKMLTGAVQTNKESVTLRAGSTDQVLVANALPGSVTLRLDVPKIPGLTASLDRTTLKNGEQATVTFHFEPTPNQAIKPTQVVILVEPLNQTIPIRVELQ